MSRNKYPEKTLENILNASTQLFIEKGYDKTSIQDIINAIGLSKGAIYHHFKSKDDILRAVLQRRSQYASKSLDKIISNTKAINSKEKLEKVLLYIATDPEIHSLDSILNSQITNPQFVVSGIKDCIKLDAPVIGKLIEDGVNDGSIQTTNPLLCAEVFLLLLNFWANPLLFERNRLETSERLDYLQNIMRALRVSVLSDELKTKLLDILYGDKTNELQ